MKEMTFEEAENTPLEILEKNFAEAASRQQATRHALAQAKTAAETAENVANRAWRLLEYAKIRGGRK